jgi:hypothetical protein
MSIIETLTEGMVNRNMEREGAALLNKWAQTGLLEGLDASQQQNMAVLLENQAKSLLKESNQMSSNGIEGFAAVAFPIVRRVFAGLIANDLVSVQPMSLPSGLIFFLDFTFGTGLGDDLSGASDRFGNEIGKSIYGTDQVGSQITGGVKLVGEDQREDFGGPGRGGMTGYAYGSATGSLEVAAADVSIRKIALSGANGANISGDDLKVLQFDADLISIADATPTYSVLEVKIGNSDLPTDLDVENLSPVVLTAAQAAALSGSVTATSLTQIRRLTTRGSSNELLMYFVGQSSDVGANTPTSFGAASGDLTGSYPQKDAITSTANKLGAIDGFNFPLEGNADIPELDIKVDSIAITAQTKKLKAKWTPELGQDLNAYHNIDAEVELTSILSEQIALEIDREILADLVNGATAATYYWSRSPGLFVNRETGVEIGASAAAPDFTGTVSEWYETLVETINDVSAQIHRKTLRGGATHIVCGPEVANILEFTAGFRANVTADADKGDIGAVKVGSLNRKFDVVVDPYFPRNVVLVARIGSSFLESGYVYAPYVPLQTTPTIFGPEDFVPRKGVMTRYAKKMVRPDMYGLVVVRGLLGESGS